MWEVTGEKQRRAIRRSVGRSVGVFVRRLVGGKRAEKSEGRSVKGEGPVRIYNRAWSVRYAQEQYGERVRMG